MTPTPAPALTDEQIDGFTEDVAFIYEGEYDPQPRRETFDAWLVAVIARAKREVAEEIAQSIETMPIAGFNGETLKWLKVAREMCAACARQIGATQ